MSKLQKKERTLEAEFAQSHMDMAHADMIAMARAYSDKTWRKERHHKKAYTKLKRGIRLQRKECDEYYPVDTRYY